MVVAILSRYPPPSSTTTNVISTAQVGLRMTVRCCLDIPIPNKNSKQNLISSHIGGGINVYTVLTTGDYDSESNSGSNSTVPARTGRNIVAPTVNPSSIPTNILTAPSSVGKAGITALPSAAKSNAASAGITAVTSTVTPSATPNAAADTLRAGSMAGVLVAGLGLLL